MCVTSGVTRRCRCNGLFFFARIIDGHGLQFIPRAATERSVVRNIVPLFSNYFFLYGNQMSLPLVLPWLEALTRSLDKIFEPITIIQCGTFGISALFYFDMLFWDGDSYVLGWSQIYCVIGDDLELQICLPLPTDGWGKYAPASLVHAVLGIKPMALHS